MPNSTPDESQAVVRRGQHVTAQDVALNIMTFTGLLFTVMSVLAIGAIIWMLFKGGLFEPKGSTPEDQEIDLIRAYLPVAVLLGAAVFSAGFGFVLLRAAGAAARDVIPKQDEPILTKLLLDKNQEGIDNYVRLSGLSGIVGVFTKLGIYGLPLATIFLTIFFATLGMIRRADPEAAKGMFDLAKLTLGAFIGSFVQRTRNETPTPRTPKSA